jgi:phage/plasmid-associated DNA primase
MIEGCRDWIQNGFVKPKCVLNETAEYFAEQDLTGQWICDCCEIAKDATSRGNELLESWREYLISKGENGQLLNATIFGNKMKQYMSQYGFDKVPHTNTGVLYTGIRLKVSTTAHWIKERCRFIGDVKTGASDLYDSWKRFLIGVGESEDYLTINKFEEEMKKVMPLYGIKAPYPFKDSYFNGICLKPASEPSSLFMVQ